MAATTGKCYIKWCTESEGVSWLDEPVTMAFDPRADEVRLTLIFPFETKFKSARRDSKGSQIGTARRAFRILDIYEEKFDILQKQVDATSAFELRDARTRAFSIDYDTSTVSVLIAGPIEEFRVAECYDSWRANFSGTPQADQDLCTGCNGLGRYEGFNLHVEDPCRYCGGTGEASKCPF